MNKLLVQQVNETLARASGRSLLACEKTLRVAAATLCTGTAGEITATTVVCDVDTADFERVEALVAEIADEYGLDAAIRPQPGSYGVRFSCPTPTVDEAVSTPGLKARLAKVLRR